ncbi:HAMP domain-containing sensor histidine kinase [Streptomyces sp. CAU 1734]|uniref:sensor histidine kinase n=1 Tax=Streptomyces sp. CAU 1734 TaxID=3140360 RepID=UPI003260A85D
MRSVRARAALGATVVVAVALIAAGVSVLLVLKTYLDEEATDQAKLTATSVAADYAAGRRLALPEPEDGEPPVQVVDGQRRVIAISDGVQQITGTGSSEVTAVPERKPPRGDDDDRDDEDDGAEDRRVSSAPVTYTEGSVTAGGDTAKYKFAAVQVLEGDETAATVYAGAPLAVEEGAVEQVRDGMLIGLPVLLVVVGGVTWLVTRHALKPVEGIRAEMAAITASEDLSRRVPEPDSRDEVARLARTTNETLTALEASVERQRRFVADASHELRSPIASLRTQLEVGAAHPQLLDVPGAVADTVRLQQLAADLLLLARLDAGERPGQARLDLGELAREEASQRTGDRVPVRVVVDAAEGPGFEVDGSRSQVARVLANLLDNAQRHARGEVVASVRRERREVVLSVADDGDGVPEEERERIFERFVRLDDARTRDEGGAGLGLAIARDVAARHGGGLTVGATPAGGALFELRLPAAPAE